MFWVWFFFLCTHGDKMECAKSFDCGVAQCVCVMSVHINPSQSQPFFVVLLVPIFFFFFFFWTSKEEWTKRSYQRQCIRFYSNCDGFWFWVMSSSWSWCLSCFIHIDYLWFCIFFSLHSSYHFICLLINSIELACLSPARRTFQFVARIGSHSTCCQKFVAPLCGSSTICRMLSTSSYMYVWCGDVTIVFVLYFSSQLN